MKVTIVETPPAPFEVVLESCGGEKCGNCEPSCEKCAEACGHPPGTLTPRGEQGPVEAPDQLATV